MKSLFRSTNEPPGLLHIAVLSARQPDQKLLSSLAARLESSGHASKVSITAATMPAACGYGQGITFLMGCETVNLEMDASDAAIRSALAHSGTAHHVLYGDTSEQLSQALELIDSALLLTNSRRPESVHNKDGSERAWVWLCDKCSDPQCEHKLLTDLLATRPSTTAPRSTEG